MVGEERSSRVQGSPDQREDLILFYCHHCSGPLAVALGRRSRRVGGYCPICGLFYCLAKIELTKDEIESLNAKPIKFESKTTSLAV